MLITEKGVPRLTPPPRIQASTDQEVFWDADFSAYAGEEEDYRHHVS